MTSGKTWMINTMGSLPSTCGTGTRRAYRWGGDGRRAARNITFSRTRSTVIVFEVTISSSLLYLNVHLLQEMLFLLLFVFKTVQRQIFESFQMMNGEGLQFLFPFFDIRVLTLKEFKHLFFRVRMDWQLQCWALAWWGFYPFCERATCWSIQADCPFHGWARNTWNPPNAACSL